MQKTVYIIVDDGPEDWGTFIYNEGFFSKSAAEKEIKNLKEGDSYKYQYLSIKPIVVKS